MTSRPLLLVALVAGDLGGCSDRSKTAGEPAPDLAAPNGRPGALAPTSDTPTDHAPEPAPLGSCDGPSGRTLRTLIVGNSQIYFWDLPRLLSELSTSAPDACPRVAAEGFTRGGQNLHRLWTGGDSEGRDLATTIREGHFDVVVIAECIDLVDLPPPKEQFVTYADLIIDAARRSGARPILYATPYADQAEHRYFKEMAEPQLSLGRERNVSVAAGGLAWLRVWAEAPDIQLHHRDNAHPGYNGSLVSAMVIYSVITHATPLALRLPEGGDCEPRPGQYEPCPPIALAERDLFRRAAWAEAMATGFTVAE